MPAPHTGQSAAAAVVARAERWSNSTEASASARVPAVQAHSLTPLTRVLQVAFQGSSIDLLAWCWTSQRPAQCTCTRCHQVVHAGMKAELHHGLHLSYVRRGRPRVSVLQGAPAAPASPTFVSLHSSGFSTPRGRHSSSSGRSRSSGPATPTSRRHRWSSVQSPTVRWSPAFERSAIRQLAVRCCRRAICTLYA